MPEFEKVQVKEIDMDVNEQEVQQPEQTTTSSSPSSLSTCVSQEQPRPHVQHSVFFQGYETRDGEVKNQFSKGYSKVTKGDNTEYMVYDGDERKRLSSDDEFKEWKNTNFKKSLTDYFTERRNARRLIDEQRQKEEEKETKKNEHDERAERYICDMTDEEIERELARRKRESQTIIERDFDEPHFHFPLYPRVQRHISPKYVLIETDPFYMFDIMYHQPDRWFSPQR